MSLGNEGGQSNNSEQFVSELVQQWDFILFVVTGIMNDNDISILITNITGYNGIDRCMNRNV